MSNKHRSSINEQDKTDDPTTDKEFLQQQKDAAFRPRSKSQRFKSTAQSYLI